MRSKIKTKAVFRQPFELKNLNEILPAGEYQVDAEVFDLINYKDPSVLVHLHPRSLHPGLSRTLTIPLADLEQAVAEDRVTGKTLSDHFLEEMLSDPMTCLVMEADGVSVDDPRRYHYSPFHSGDIVHDVAKRRSREKIVAVRPEVVPFTWIR